MFQKINTAKCITDTPLEIPSICTPIRGSLTLYSRSTRRQLSTSSILTSIQRYIERPESYVSENILAVTYIGKRESVGVGIIDPSLLMRPKFGGRRLSSAAAAGAISDVVGGERYLIAGLLAGCMVLFLKRRRESQRFVSQQDAITSLD